MGTSWAEVITNSAMVYIDDLRLREEIGRASCRERV